MSLESIGKLVEQHAAVSSPAQQKAAKMRAEHEIVRRMFTSLMIGMAILGVGVFLLVVNKTLNLGAAVSMLTAFLVLGGTGYATYAVLNGIRKGASLGSGDRRQLNPSTDKSLPTNPFPEALSSVTERTTQLINGGSTDQEEQVK
jgi:hypothetical protein